jgi:RNase adapter protein RapZ
MIKKVISFGYKFGPVPTAANVWDVREQLTNPWSKLNLRDLPGTHPAVVRFVKADPGFEPLVKAIIMAGGEVVAIGCTGGKHRSVVLANAVAFLTGAEVSHRDLK